MTTHEHPVPSDEFGTNTERLVFFSDAVFAIAITLLVLEIHVPDLSDSASAMEQFQSVVALWPHILSFIISFLVIAAFWAGHHRMFTYINRYNNGLIWLNFSLLLCIAFMPVPTALLGDTGTELVPVIFYALTLTLTSFASGAVWRHAVRNRLIVDNLDPRIQALFSMRSLLTVVVCVLSIPVAFLSPTLASIVWILIFFVRRATDQMYLYRTARHN
jgi:uncharacterized membrane protein